MPDERIDPIGSVTPEPTCAECRRRPRWAGIAVVRTLLCPALDYGRDGRVSDAMARLGESAS